MAKDRASSQHRHGNEKRHEVLAAADYTTTGCRGKSSARSSTRIMIMASLKRVSPLLALHDAEDQRCTAAQH